MTPRPFRFRADAAIPAAGPGAVSAGYTSDNLPQGRREVWRTALAFPLHSGGKDSSKTAGVSGSCPVLSWLLSDTFIALSDITASQQQHE